MSRSIEDSVSKSYLNCEGFTKEVSEKNFAMLLTDHSCNILVRKVATFALD